MTELDAVIVRSRPAGLVLDSNLLLLLIVGLVDSHFIANFKRTRMFAQEDFNLLIHIMRRFEKCSITPHVLTEVSNFIGQIKEPYLDKCRAQLAQFINSSKEHYSPAKDLLAMKEYFRFGVSDASLSELAHRRFLILTVDAALAYHLGIQSLPVVNFSHMRQTGWGS
jgi:hypothetical protein